MNPMKKPYIRLSAVLVVVTTICAAGQSLATSHQNAGDQIVSGYRSYLSQPRKNRSIPRYKELCSELAVIQANEAYKQTRRMTKEEFPNYIALKSITMELGNDLPPCELDRKVITAFPASVRRSWPLETRRIWLNAFCCYDAISGFNPKYEIEVLKEHGLAVDTAEASLIPHNTLNGKNGYIVAERLIHFAQAHPRNIACVMLATQVLSVRLSIGKIEREPLRLDLADQLLPLESRTLRNMNALLHDEATSLGWFDYLRITSGRRK